MNMNYRWIGGEEFEAVRVKFPRPHWIPRHVGSDKMYSNGNFHGSTRKAMWADMEHIFKLIDGNMARFLPEGAEPGKPPITKLRPHGIYTAEVAAMMVRR
jgi:hypothetical protein